MRATVARKLRKYAKRNWIEYVQAIVEWPFTVRWRFAWRILFHAKKWRKASHDKMAIRRTVRKE